MNFCTLFDSNYLDKGLAMYYSLMRNTKDFKLYILAFDETCFRILSNLSLEHMTVIRLSDFENPQLLSVKKKRSNAEYCWTCTGFLIKFVLDTYFLTECTYVDADIYFFADPKVLYNEIEESKCDVSIISHHFGDKYEDRRLLQKAGKYCVEFNTFFNDKNAINVLDWWCSQCLKQCSAISDEQGFGDQKYIEKWKDMFENIYEIKNLGAGVAPWNVSNYNFFKKNRDIIYLSRKGDDIPLIFYHFHNIKYLKDKQVDIGVNLRCGKVDTKLIEFIYLPYLNEIEKIRKELEDKYSIQFFKKGSEEPSNLLQRMAIFWKEEKNIIVLFLTVWRYVFRKKKDIINL